MPGRRPTSLSPRSATTVLDLVWDRVLGTYRRPDTRRIVWDRVLGTYRRPDTRACIQLGGVCRERNRIKRGTPFYDPELGVILGIPKSVVEGFMCSRL